MISFPIWIKNASFLLCFMPGSACARSLQTTPALLRKKLRKLWNRVKKNAVYQLAALLYPQDQLVLFSSSKKDKFGNITVLAQKLREMHMPFLWLTQEQLTSHPLPGLVTFARARVLVVDAASPSAYVHLSRNTSLIHCWHACGAYKKIAFDAKRRDRDDASEEKRIQRIHRGINWLVCTSEGAGQLFAKAFRLPPERLLSFGSPRLDAILLKQDVPAPPVYTVLYAPTYRTHAGNIRCHPPLPDANTLRNSLVSRLGETVRLAFRGHPTSPLPDTLKGWEDWSDSAQEEALRQASVLITDYSSIFFDFLPFKRPIIFYVPDIDDYQRQERELYFSPYDLFPETTCSDERTLIQLLEYCRHMNVDYKNIWQKYMSACDGKSAERLCIFIQKLMQKKHI